MNRERIAEYAGQIAEVIADGGNAYAAAAGIIRAYADMPGMADADRLAGIRDALAGLDQARGQHRARLAGGAS